MRYLYAFNNQIAAIDLSTVPVLLYLIIYNNQLTSLDLTSNNYLQDVLVHNNQLTSLNLPSQSVIGQFVCANNPDLSGELDFSGFPALNQLVIDSTGIERLNLRNGRNALMLTVTARGCSQLGCVIVDDADASYLNNWHLPPQAVVVEDPALCNAGVEETEADNIEVFPVPASDNINVLANGTEIEELVLYDVAGKFVTRSRSGKHEVDVSALSPGVYFLKIKTGKSVFVWRIVVR